ncbi:histone deacetylase RPD3, partial [Mycena floridula]
MSKKRVAYYYDNDVGSYIYGSQHHPMRPHRLRVTHELVAAYGMLSQMQFFKPKRASEKTMTSFHTDEYIHFLSTVTPETAERLTYHGTRFLVGEDNPAFEGVFEFCSISAGGSIDCAQRMNSQDCDIAINWAGGLHHAKKREASGFCYINDIVLGILELLRTYSRVLYIDIDCHHGDGVEEAFYTTDRVMTCSFHKYGEYFPGTGTQEDRGKGKGKGYSLNLPLKDGIGDEAFKGIFEPVIAKIMDVYRPTAVVLQCGADSLAGDKLGCFNLSMEGHADCVKYLRKYDVPLKLLGGGGYTMKNVAKLWAFETAVALGIEDTIDRNLPWNSYFEWFGPRYKLEVLSNNMEDLNVKELDLVRSTALQQLDELTFAPSVGIQEVPRENLTQHLGISPAVEAERDDLDERLAQHVRYAYDLQLSETSEDEGAEEERHGLHDGSSIQPRQRRHYAAKPRMSIMQNVRHHSPQQAKRRFFRGVPSLNETYQKGFS